jgi:hypothetical protein
MRFKCSSVLLAVTILCACIRPVSAHHSITAEFDLEKRLTMTGVEQSQNPQGREVGFPTE